MIAGMAIEAFEDNLFFAAWDNLAKPHVHTLLDNLYGPITADNKNDWVNSALRESTEFVITMMSQMAYMKIIQAQDKFFEVLFKVYRRLKAALLKGISDIFNARKARIKTKRGVVALTLFNNQDKGVKENIEVQKIQAMELNNVIQARQASAASVSALDPAAKSVDYSLNKKKLYADLAYKKGSLAAETFQAKSMLGAFSAADVTAFKKMSAANGGGTQNVQLSDMNGLRGIYGSVAANGAWLGNAEIELSMLSYFGYLPPNK